MLKFQEESLKHDLERLASRSRAVFAACCAQRLADVYHRFLAALRQEDRASACDDALDYVWTHILTPPEDARTNRLFADVMTLIPDQDAPGWTPLTAYAEDALSALAYSL